VKAGRFTLCAPMLALLAVSGCAGGRYVDAARNSERRGDYAIAYDQYLRAATTDPGNSAAAQGMARVGPFAAQYWETQGHLAEANGRYADAWKMFMRALEIRPDHPSAAQLIRRLERERAPALVAARTDYLARGSRALQSVRPTPIETAVASAGGIPDETTDETTEPEEDIGPPPEAPPRVEPTRVAAAPPRKEPVVETRVAMGPSGTNHYPPEDKTPSPQPVSLPKPTEPAPKPVVTSPEPTPPAPRPTPPAPEATVVKPQPTPPAPQPVSPPAASPPSKTPDEAIKPPVEIGGPAALTGNALASEHSTKKSTGDAERASEPPPVRRAPRPTRSEPDRQADYRTPKSFLVVHTLSRKDKRYPKAMEAIDGITVALKDTDEKPLDADLELYQGKRRINRIKDFPEGRSEHFIGASGRRFRLTIIDIHYKSQTVRFGISAM